MLIWKTDMATQRDALAAAGLAAFACFWGVALSGQSLFQMWPRLRMGHIPLMAPYYSLILAIFVVAGIRFAGARGWRLGIAAAALFAINIIFRIIEIGNHHGVTIARGTMIAVSAVFLITIVNGIRGVWALQSGRYDHEGLEEVFD